MLKATVNMANWCCFLETRDTLAHHAAQSIKYVWDHLQVNSLVSLLFPMMCIQGSVFIIYTHGVYSPRWPAVAVCTAPSHPSWHLPQSRTGSKLRTPIFKQINVSRIKLFWLYCVCWFERWALISEEPTGIFLWWYLNFLSHYVSFLFSVSSTAACGLTKEQMKLPGSFCSNIRGRGKFMSGNKTRSSSSAWSR